LSGEEGAFTGWLTELKKTISTLPGYVSVVVIPQVAPNWKQSTIVLLTLYPIVMLEQMFLNPLLTPSEQARERRKRGPTA
jgi:antibiotic biosynthesis monooxygenase (ABM) superfamily enzyme